MTGPFDEAIEREKTRDPLGEVEKFTGCSYKLAFSSSEYPESSLCGLKMNSTK